MRKLDDLGIRMKTFYEEASKTKLVRRMPVVIRIDGKAFHTFTRGFHKPFDEILIKSMQDTMKYLCENIQGCVLGYTQSDEISLVLVDYQKLESCAWFENEVQKMCSISASMATLAFNKNFSKYVEEYVDDCAYQYEVNGTCGPNTIEYKYGTTLLKAMNKGAMFDARVFNIPKEEITNYIYWRQVDAIRNSIQMVGQANFSHKELQGKSCNDIRNMLVIDKSISWDDFPIHQKRGSCCVKNKLLIKSDGITETCQLRDSKQGESNWIIDNNIPIFKGEDREYVDWLIMIGG